MIVPFPNWEPDKSKFDGQNTDTVQNVLPLVGGWGPMPAHSPVGSALPAECKGALSVADSDGVSWTFVGTQEGLYRFDTTSLAFVDLTTTATTYDVPEGEFWSFRHFGNLILATNQNDGLYYFDMASGTEFVLASNAPKAKFVTNVGEYVVLMNLDGFPNRIQWSEIGSVTDWTVGDNGAGLQDFPDGGDISGATFGEEQVFVLQRRCIRAMQYIGGSYTFQFELANTARGCKSPWSIVQAANTFFFLDEDGMYQGPQGTPIGAEKVNRYVTDTYDLNLWDTVQGAADPTNKIVWWLFTFVGGVKEMIGYDWQLERWTRSDTDMTYIFSAESPAYTLEGLDNVNTSIDALPYSLDSRAYLGGRQALGGIDTSNFYGLFEGSNLAAVVETHDAKLQGPNQRAFVNGYRLITDAADHTGQVAGKDTHYSSLSFDAAVAPISASGLITTRKNARLHRFRGNVTAAETWTYIQGVMPEVRPGGRR
jgi:hypothetical protein